MRKRLRDLFEAVFFAGLQPDAPVQLPWRVRLANRLEYWINRLLLRNLRPVDPFYLTNQSGWKKVRGAILVSMPLILVVLAVVAVTFNIPGRWLSSTESANYGPIASATPELEVVAIEVRREGSTPHVVGLVRNNSERPSRGAAISLNVTNARGSLLGSVSAVVHNIPAHGTASFRVPAAFEGAAMALVRDTRPL